MIPTDAPARAALRAALWPARPAPITSTSCSGNARGFYANQRGGLRLGDVWETVASGRETTLQQRARCRIAASFAVDSARAAMDLMYRAGGTTSNERSHQLARCWRDLHVVAQAASTMPDWYAVAGRALLGLDPGPRLT